MIIPRCSNWPSLAVHPAVLVYLLITLIASSPVHARECFWYTDTFGRRRRRCRGLVPGIIAAVVVGFFVILAFLSLALVLRRRQRRLANLEAPSTFTGATGAGGQYNQMMSQQPPAFRLPAIPSTTSLPRPPSLISTTTPPRKTRPIPCPARTSLRLPQLTSPLIMPPTEKKKKNWSCSSGPFLFLLYLFYFSFAVFSMLLNLKKLFLSYFKKTIQITMTLKEK